jgi:hypothetical protein
MSYLDNGHVRIGVDLSKGGAITYLSKSGGPNMVNDFDLGRQIQMSYYSGPVPFEPNGKKPNESWAGLGWNPIQSGDCFGHSSKTLECRNDGRHIYLKCVPMQWPLDGEPGECTFEAWIDLRGDTVEVKNRIVIDRADLTQYPARAQELPAVYTNAPWHRLMTYVGDRPFTGDAPTEIPQHPWGKDGPWTSFQGTENWAALLDDTGWGVGVWTPETESISGGFVGAPGVGGSSDSPTGYIAPNLVEILDHNIAYDSLYVLILGDLNEIRGYASSHRPKRPTPDYEFRSDRRHWYYVNAQDEGCPIHGELRVRLEQPDPQMIGPVGCWPAADGPILTIVAAYKTAEATSQVFWGRLNSPGFAEARSLTFQAIPDGKYHAYHIDLSKSPEYRGSITQLRFDPEPNGHPSDEIRVRSIRISN